MHRWPITALPRSLSPFLTRRSTSALDDAARVFSPATRRIHGEICKSLDAVRVTEGAQKPSIKSFSRSTTDRHSITCSSTDNSANKWITRTYASGKSSGQSLLQACADVIATSRHLSPRDLASTPRCESRSGRIVGKHVEALTRSASSPFSSYSPQSSQQRYGRCG